METKTVRTEYHDEVAVVKLERGVTNPLNLQLVNELAGALQGVRHDADVRGLVLSSANTKFFSIGFDIPELFELAEDDFATFLRAFNRLCLDLYTLPKPTVAAITGHAIAGGCILALCCDYRFIAQGRKLMGLNEILLGVPVPYVADCILQQVVGARNARDIAYTGQFYAPEALLQMSLVDRVLPSEQVQPQAVEKAEALGALPPAAFAPIKRHRVETVEARILKRLAEKEQVFIERWYSGEARERLREAMAKF